MGVQLNPQTFGGTNNKLLLLVLREELLPDLEEKLGLTNASKFQTRVVPVGERDEFRERGYVDAHLQDPLPSPALLATSPVQPRDGASSGGAQTGDFISFTPRGGKVKILLYLYLNIFRDNCFFTLFQSLTFF
uniref:Uncharacterized protein n=1 Tax=Oryza punctata TaxID=4537 RepID=A0A0E0MDK3_ORYPU